LGVQAEKNPAKISAKTGIKENNKLCLRLLVLLVITLKNEWNILKVGKLAFFFVFLIKF
jgi:hypothetical protein